MAPTSSSRAFEHTSDTLRPPPDSGGEPLPPFESGVPPMRSSLSSSSLAARGEAHAQAAVSACARAEANLGSLRRTLQHLSEAVSSAEQAQEDVVMELDQLRRLLAQGDEEQLGLRHRIALLEQTLERVEREGARERAYLIEQQDTFIGGLWDEHEQELDELKQRLLSAESALKASQDEGRAAIDAARASRTSASELAQRLRYTELELSRVQTSEQELRTALSQTELELEDAEAAFVYAGRERYQAGAELSRVRPSPSGRITSIREPVADAAAAQGFTPVGQIPLVTRAVGSNPHLARGDGSSDFRSITPPEELRQAITQADGNANSSSAGFAARKPDVSTRPLIGYALGPGDVTEEHVEQLAPSTRPPR